MAQQVSDLMVEVRENYLHLLQLRDHNLDRENNPLLQQLVALLP